MFESSQRTSLKLGNVTIEHRPASTLPPTVHRAKQVHGGTIIEAADAVERYHTVRTPDGLPVRHRGLPEADGLVVHQDNPYCSTAIITADCLPLVFIGEQTAVALHVSRKSILQDIVYNIKYHLRPKDVTHIYLGPHICSKHFTFETIGSEVDLFCRQFPAACDQRDTMNLSLRRAMQSYFEAWNITPDQVTEDGRCTYEDNTLPSYRRSLAAGEKVADQLATVIRFRPSFS